MKIETQLIHAGKQKNESGAVMSPITLSTTFERAEDQLSFHEGYIYSRYDNPNRRAVETKLALMEQGEVAITFSSGLAAAMAVFHSLKIDDHIILPDDTYFGVRAILMNLYPQFRLHFTLVDMTDLAAVEAAILPNTTLIWLETPSNPAAKITDIQAVVRIAQKYNLLTCADNTWATPFFTLPLTLGVDIALHSTTKYFGGHSDILGGVLIFAKNNERAQFIRNYQKIGGAVPSPFDCWLLNRSLATFAVRMPVHASNAMALATYLSTHEAIEKVLYPGLPDDEGHHIAKKQMQHGFGGMLSILIKNGRENALDICKKLKIFTHATSLGGVESLIEHRKSIEGETSATPENLLRISCGIENINDLINDFEQALR
jgi:cystathionine gamma-synthase